MRGLKNNLLALSVVMALVSVDLCAPHPTSSFARLVARSISQAALSDTSDDLSIDASLGDEQISLERKKHRSPKSCCLVVISIIGVLVATRPISEGAQRTIDLRATITGNDAVQASLLYGLAWLDGTADPLGAVRALGYDIDVSTEHEQRCTDGPRTQVCAERARRLATLLDATLALGSTDERLRFRQDAATLGVAPDCAVQEP